MQTSRCGLIDVGTNSVKLLIADVSNGAVTPVLETSEQTRLGRGFYESHLLQPGPIAETAAAVATFATCAKDHGASSVRVIATSAARDAKNSSELIRAIEQASGLRLEVISGEEEADLAFRGVISNKELAKHPLLILDVGGGSSEFILGEHGHACFRHSFNLGTVRLLEKLPHSDPPTAEELSLCRKWLKEFFATEVAPRLRAPLATCSTGKVILVGTGGTSTLLARMEKKMNDYDRDAIEATVLSRAQITAQVERLWSMPLARRQQVPGLPPKRADVILTGVAIFEAVMEEFGFEELRNSTRGLRFAAVAEER